MQIFAFDNKGTYVSAFEAEKKKDYFCPECKKILRLRSGTERRAHFYHLQTTKQCHSSQKTPLHLTIQLFLANLLPLSECHLEKPFPTIKRIADCVWERQKLIFEIQCSFISKQEVKKRMRDYSSCGYTVVWIFHESLFSPQRSSAAEQYLKKFPHYYTNINLASKGFIYDRYEKQKLPINPLNPLFFKRPFCQWFKKHSWSLHFEGDRHTISHKKPKQPKKLFERFLKSCAILILKN